MAKQYKCEKCGEEFSRPQARGAHLRYQHGVKGTARSGSKRKKSRRGPGRPRGKGRKGARRGRRRTGLELLNAPPEPPMVEVSIRVRGDRGTKPAGTFAVYSDKPKSVVRNVKRALARG